MGRIWEHDVKTCDTVLEFGKYGVNDANSPYLLKHQLSDAQLTQARTFVVGA